MLVCFQTINKPKKMKLASVTSITKIRHNNEINKTFSTMSLASRRVVFLALAQLDPKNIIAKGATFRIYAHEYADICGIDKDTAYAQLKDACENLQKQLIAIPKSELLPPFARVGDPLWKRPEGGGIRMLNITEYCDYAPDTGYVDVSFTRQMEPYICMLKGNYTTQVLLSAARLSDANAGNLYQLIRQKISQGKRQYFDIEVNELKDELGLYTMNKKEKIYAYPKFKEFNRSVLGRSLKTINDTTEINKAMVEIIEKKGRKAHLLRVSYEINNQLNLEL